MHEASRTLVKSPPELWAECSDAAALARHLGGFGEIRITRLDPETAIAWEGENVRGTVRIEPAGWGTKVILTAEQEAGEAEAVPVAEASEPPEPIIEAGEPPEPPPDTPAARQRRFARLRAFFRGADPPPRDGVAEAEPVVVVEPEPMPQPAVPEPLPPVDLGHAESALAAALDSLGQAHHRPYSRA
jgi:hypothetical protein